MKESKITIDSLAIMVNKGFNEVKNDMGKTRDDIGEMKEEMNTRLDKLEKGHDEMDNHLDEANARLGKIERGQEEIKLKLDNVAYRFELQELQRRVELLEKKAKFA